MFEERLPGGDRSFGWYLGVIRYVTISTFEMSFALSVPSRSYVPPKTVPASYIRLLEVKKTQNGHSLLTVSRVTKAYNPGTLKPPPPSPHPEARPQDARADLGELDIGDSRQEDGQLTPARPDGCAVVLPSI